MSLEASEPGSVPSRLDALAKRSIELVLLAFQAGKVLRVGADLKGACARVRAGRSHLAGGGVVAGVSIGGSNSSVLLCEHREDGLRLIDAQRLPNPSTPEPWQSFLDRLVLSRPALRDYFAHHPAPRLGVSIAVPCFDGVPIHPSKIPTLVGLVARSREGNATADCHLPRGLHAWLKGHGLRASSIECEGDAPVAHLGGLTLPDSAKANSLLFVCGTGMACADDASFILPGVYPILGVLNESLLPVAETESGQFQYLCAGKGMHGLLRRSLEESAQDPGSPLHGIPDFGRWIRGAQDSRLAYDLWQVSESPTAALPPSLQPLREGMTETAWRAVVALGRRVGLVAGQAMAGTIATTLAHQPDMASSTVSVFPEGSIATNPFVAAKIRAETESLLRTHPLLTSLAPGRILWRTEGGKDLHGETALGSCLDLTLRGAAALAALGR